MVMVKKNIWMQQSPLKSKWESPGLYSVFVVLILISPEPVWSPTVKTSVLCALPLLITAVYTPDEKPSRSMECVPRPSGCSVMDICISLLACLKGQLLVN